MKGTASCSLKNSLQPITVGDPLVLVCKGAFSWDFKHPLFIELEDPDYSLVVLKTLKQEDSVVELLVTSYRTGLFAKNFRIGDGEQFLTVNDLSFEVQSVLSAQDKNPAPAFGPFKSAGDSFVLLISWFFLLCVFSCILVFGYRFFKRKNFIAKVIKRRKSLNPAKNFIWNLRKEPKKTEKKIHHLENSFKFFLEDYFLIPAIHQKNATILKQLKHYHSKLKGEPLRKIQSLLYEFSHWDKESKDSHYIQLKKICKGVVFSLQEDEQ